jgi:DNA-binding transcriptional MerR regulator
VKSDAPTLRIGELAARSGRSVHTIRWYDGQGLIPGVVRGPGGQRLFAARHVEWLGLLERLRSTGMSIAQIRRYTSLVRQGQARLGEQRELLSAHREQVAATIDSWRRSLALIDAKIAYYDEWLATGSRPAGIGLREREAAAMTGESARPAAVGGARSAKRRAA